MTSLAWTSLSTPVGVVSVGCSQAGVARVRYGHPAVAASADVGASRSGDERDAATLFADSARAELIEYFRGGRQTFDTPVDWSAISGTQRQVLAVLAETVGYGRTISYGELARRAGLTDDAAKRPAFIPARAVGTIMASNPIPVIVPCHRVVASDGLGGYSGGAGTEVKRWLLILEGSQPPTLDWAAAG